MQVTKITATTRTDNGKGVCRRLRASGKLPAVTYGQGTQAQPLTVSPDEVYAVLTSDRGRNSLVELDIDGKSVHAMINDYQYHPVTRKLLHADFFQVTDDTTVEVAIPLRLTGKSRGVTMGGKLRQVFREIPLRCAPKNIPVELVYDITNLELDQSVKVADLAMPEGCEPVYGAKRTVASVAADRRAKKAETDEEEAK